jgi:RHS repeat-associated protein
MGTPIARIQNRNDRTELQFHGLASSTLATVESGVGVLEAGDPTPPGSGTINAAFTYSPWGEVIETAGAETGTHRRRLNDKYHDASSGLAYYGYRYYDQVAMNWTQADPLYRFAPDRAWTDPRRGLLYTFSMNNALRYLDPDGRETLPDGRTLTVGVIWEELDELPGSGIEAAASFAVDIAVDAVGGTLVDAARTAWGVGSALADGDYSRAATELATGVGATLVPGLNKKAADEVVDAVAGSGKTATKSTDLAGGIPDDAYVVRGGAATPDQIANGIGPHRDVAGLTGFSAQSKPGASVEELASTGGVGGGPFPHGKVSVTTVKELRCIGCDVVKSPGAGANHVTVTPGPATPAQISEKFTVQPNPARPQ